MKRLVLSCFAFLTLTLAASTAQADIWTCTYTGRYTGSGGGSLVWALKWTGTGGGTYAISGTYADRYGTSKMSGSCNSARYCLFDQFYTSGSAAGKWFYWKGTYTDANAGPGRTINTFGGTWGYTPRRRSSGGTWNAQAVCVRQL